MAIQVERMVAILEARLDKYEKGLAKARGETNRQFTAIERRGKQMEARLAATGSNLGMALTKGLAVAGSLKGAQSLIDSATRIENALKIAGLAGDELNQVYGRLFASAQRNAAPLETLVTLYGRAALVQKELKVSQEEMLNFTDKVALALRISGQSAEESSGALLQLSQALGSGVVRAEEFNSILEGALPIAQAAAAGLEEAGGSVAKLRQLVVDGKISSEVFFRAFEAGSAMLEQKVAGAEMTVAQHLIRLRNVLIDAAGDFDKGSGAAEAFGKMLSDVADIIQQTDFSQMGAEIARYIQWVNDARVAVLSWLQAHGQATGESLGTDAFGSWLTGGAVQKQFGPITVTSSRALQNRIDEAFGNAVNTAGTLTEQAIRDSYNRRGQATSPGKTDRLPPSASPGTISLNDYAPPKASGGAGGGGRKGRGSRQNEFEREIEQIKERTAAIQAETAAMASINPLVDDYGRALEKARVTQELLAAAQKAGIAITPELRAQIEQLANGYANASAEAEQLAESQDRAREMADEFRGMAKDVLGGFISDLRAGKSASEALANAMNKVLDKLVEIGLNTAFENLFSGGSGGFLSALFGPSKSAFSFAPGMGLWSSGGYTGPGGKYQPAGVVHKGEYVFDQAAVRAAGGPATLDALRQSIKGYANGGYVGLSPRAAPMRPASAPQSAGTVVNIVDNAGVEKRSERRRGPDGSDIIDIVIERVKGDLAAGGFDKAMGGRFGAIPTRVTR